MLLYASWHIEPLGFMDKAKLITRKSGYLKKELSTPSLLIVDDGKLSESKRQLIIKSARALVRIQKFQV